VLVLAPAPAFALLLPEADAPLWEPVWSEGAACWDWPLWDPFWSVWVDWPLWAPLWPEAPALGHVPPGGIGVPSGQVPPAPLPEPPAPPGDIWSPPDGACVPAAAPPPAEVPAALLAPVSAWA
jgi:hypothetical protein